MITADRPLKASTYCLALGTVAVGTSGHSVAGLLPEMSAFLRTSPAAIGQLVTIFALTCALAGPVLAVATGRWERRTLLVVSLVITGMGNALAAAASTFVVLAAGRVITALGAATTTAVAVGIAAHVNRPDRRARAMSVVLAGLTTALLVGVPGSSALADAIGYRAVLWIVAGLCCAAAGAIALAAPTVAAPPVLSIRERLDVARSRPVLSVLSASLLAWTSCFAVYPYLSALLDHYATHNASLSLLLAGYGIGAAAGNLVGGRLCDQFGPRRPLLMAMGGSSLLLLVVVPAVRTPVGAMFALAAWGFTSWSVNPATNAWLIRLAPDRSALLLALNASAIYLGMGMGGLLGGAVITAAGVSYLTPVAAGVALAGFWVLAASERHTPRRHESSAPVRRSPTPVGAQLQFPLR